MISIRLAETPAKSSEFGSSTVSVAVNSWAKARRVAQSYLERHPALQHPPAGLGRSQAGDDPFEDYAAAQPVEPDAGARRVRGEAAFESRPQCRRGAYVMAPSAAPVPVRR
jgi:hypothetical protein